jgi:hypothetical protein
MSACRAAVDSVVDSVAVHDVSIDALSELLQLMSELLQLMSELLQLGLAAVIA